MPQTEARLCQIPVCAQTAGFQALRFSVVHSWGSQCVAGRLGKPRTTLLFRRFQPANFVIAEANLPTTPGPQNGTGFKSTSKPRLVVVLPRTGQGGEGRTACICPEVDVMPPKKASPKGHPSMWFSLSTHHQYKGRNNYKQSAPKS